MSDLLQDCDMPEDITALPIKFNSPPVYGSEDATFNEFMAPGMIIMIVFFLAICLTGEAFISEKEVRDHPFKTSASFRGVGVSPIANVCRC